MKFGLFERRIRLEGEAYFEVTHNPRRPFVVEFEGGEIQVLGTSFNVKAYRDDDIVAVTLDEGRVVLDDRRGGRFELSPSEQLLYDRRSGEGRIVRGADAMRYSIWKDDVISFRDTPLAEVLETLSRWYVWWHEPCTPDLGLVFFRLRWLERSLSAFDRYRRCCYQPVRARLCA